MKDIVVTTATDLGFLYHLSQVRARIDVAEHAGYVEESRTSVDDHLSYTTTIHLVMSDVKKAEIAMTALLMGLTIEANRQRYRLDKNFEICAIGYQAGFNSQGELIFDTSHEVLMITHWTFGQAGRHFAKMTEDECIIIIANIGLSRI